MKDDEDDDGNGDAEELKEGSEQDDKNSAGTKLNPGAPVSQFLSGYAKPKRASGPRQTRKVVRNNAENGAAVAAVHTTTATTQLRGLKASVWAN